MFKKTFEADILQAMEGKMGRIVEIPSELFPECVQSGMFEEYTDCMFKKYLEENKAAYEINTTSDTRSRVREIWGGRGSVSASGSRATEIAVTVVDGNVEPDQEQIIMRKEIVECLDECVHQVSNFLRSKFNEFSHTKQ